MCKPEKMEHFVNKRTSNSSILLCVGVLWLASCGGCDIPMFTVMLTLVEEDENMFCKAQQLTENPD